MNPLMNSVGSNAEGKLNCINAVVITHNATVILIDYESNPSVQWNVCGLVLNNSIFSSQVNIKAQPLMI